MGAPARHRLLAASAQPGSHDSFTDDAWQPALNLIGAGLQRWASQPQSTIVAVALLLPPDTCPRQLDPAPVAKHDLLVHGEYRQRQRRLRARVVNDARSHRPLLDELVDFVKIVEAPRGLVDNDSTHECARAASER